MCDSLKPTQRGFKPEMFVLHVGTYDLPLNKSPREVSEDNNSSGINENRK